MCGISRFFILISLGFLGCSRVDKSPDQTKLFQLIPSSYSNIDFSNTLQESRKVNILTYEYFYNGGGVALGDINNDGLPDVFLTGNQVRDRLYLNRGDFKFEDITLSAFEELENGWSTGVTMADVNGDGWLDIYVSKSGKLRPNKRENQLFINNGDLTFTEAAKEYGLADRGFGTQALFFDYDLDNDLDAFILNHNVIIYKDVDGVAIRKKTDPFTGDRLYKNENGVFIDVSDSSGLNRNPIGYGLGVASGDFNKDGYPDLYVTNDYEEPDYLYINNGNGTFSESIKQKTKHISNFGMGVDVADINNDLWPDVFVADMVAEDNYRQKTNMRSMNPEKFYKLVENGFHHQYMFNTLQLNNKNGMFSEVAQLSGVSNSDWSWSTLLVDLNNDGNKDFFITNGYRKEISNKDFVSYMQSYIDSAKSWAIEDKLNVIDTLLARIPSQKLKNYVFEGNERLDYKKRTDEWGLDHFSFSNGASIADLDGDGDLDLVINNIDEETFVYRNNASEKYSQNYLRVELNGPMGNTSGIGSKIEFFYGGKSQFHEHYLTRGYQSSVDDIIHFGMDTIEIADSLKITWPDGLVQVVKKIRSNQLLALNYENAKEPDTVKKETGVLFENITEKVDLDFIHKENLHDDFKKEMLLPHKMSQFGPAASVGDINGDGLEDIFVGGAFGYEGRLFFQTLFGSFEEKRPRAISLDKHFEDVSSALFDVDSDDDLDLYVVSGGNEFPQGSDEYLDRLYINDGNGNFSRQELPQLNVSGSVVKPYDFDSDGDLDLFIGGRLIPQKYPSPASSFILINKDGRLEIASKELNSVFTDIGLVTDAKWTDLNENGNPEIILVGEWMPIMVFEFENGHFNDRTDFYNLRDQTGWWYSINTSDIDDDGDLDLIGGNLGLNYKYKTSVEEPFQIYYSDFDNNGTGDIVLGYFSEGDLFPLRGRQCSSDQMPFIKEKFGTYHDFGSSSLEEIYGQKNLSEALNYSANTFASTIYLNENGLFQPQEMQRMAQISSINTTLVEDYDGDEVKDILLAGNLYPVEVETIRNDAFYGLLMKGQTSGEFEPLLEPETGFMADGDVKHLVKIKLSDGSNGVLVVRNSGPVELFRINEVENKLAFSIR